MSGNSIVPRSTVILRNQFTRSPFAILWPTNSTLFFTFNYLYLNRTYETVRILALSYRLAYDNVHRLTGRRYFPNPKAGSVPLTIKYGTMRLRIWKR